MLQNTLDALSEDLIFLSRQLTPLQGRERELKELLRLFEGQTYLAKDGSQVSISKTTSDRSDGVRVELDVEKFLALDPAIRAQLEKMGIINTVPKIVKGSAPRITVKLK